MPLTKYSRRTCAALAAAAILSLVHTGLRSDEPPAARTMDRTIAVVDRLVITERDVMVRVFEMRLFDRSLESVPDEELVAAAASECVDETLLEFWAELEVGDPPTEDVVRAGKMTWARYEALAGSPKRLEARLEDAKIPTRTLRLHTEDRARAELRIRAALAKELGPDALPKGRDDARSSDRVRLAQIVLVPLVNNDPRSDADCLERALAIRREIAAGLSFEHAAAIYSQEENTASLGGDLGWLERDMLSQEIRDAISDLDAGAVSSPVRTPLGYHLLSITDYESPMRAEMAKRFREAEIRVLRRLRDENDVSLAPGITLSALPKE